MQIPGLEALGPDVTRLHAPVLEYFCLGWQRSVRQQHQALNAVSETE